MINDEIRRYIYGMFKKQVIQEKSSLDQRLTETEIL